MTLATDAYIGGAWRAAPARFEVRDPADGAVVADVADCDEAMIDAAIGAAMRAFPSWRATPGRERGTKLAAFADRMLGDERVLAELCTAENGKPIKEAIAEVRYAASFLRWFAEQAERDPRETIASERAGQDLSATREPIGPCALITPWNFPYAMITRKLGAALAAGCTVVIKPAEQTPLSALALSAHAHAVGIPAGVVNVVPASDGGRIGGYLVRAPGIRKVSFTGSTEVGRAIQRAAADDLKRVSLELGGNAPLLVFADADLDVATAGSIIAKFRNTGQTCIAANRFLVERSVAPAFQASLVAAIGKLVLGRGRDPGVDLGPLIDDAAVAKVARLVGDAIARGAQPVLGSPPAPGSRMVAPVVLAGVRDDMQLWREEIFGPVVAIRTFADDAEAIRLANDTEFGLAAYAFTRDPARAERLRDQLEVGMLGVNEAAISMARAPFGGVKHSGYGREGSTHGLDDYTQLKFVAARLP